jgi:hypothetical protein
MMNRRLMVGCGAVLALVAAACNSDKLTSVNKNPNSPTDAPSTALFTNAARNGVGRWLNGVGGTRYAFLSQHFAEVQYPDDDAYSRLRASSTSGLFNSSYNVELEDLQIIIQRGRAASKPGFWAPATVLKSWEFGVLTDVFGDIPYSQAFKIDSGVLKPQYDLQKDIYTDLFARLNEASAALGTAANELGSADPIFAGDPVGWRKFANSLRLRHALRLINVDSATADAQLAAALGAAGGLITTNADNAILRWPGDGIYDNPWAANFKGRDDHRISNRLLTYLRDYSDPRLPVYAMPAGVDQPEIAGRTLRYCPSGSPPCYVGLFNALSQAQASPLVTYTSRPGEIFYPGVTAYGTFGGSGGTFPSFLMTAAEVEFIRAEAAERGLGGLTPAQAGAFYDAAITRSMEMWAISPVPAASISPAAIATYLSNPLVSYASATTKVERLKRIAIQKWLALYYDSIQAWTEFRRTCQPAILHPGPTAVSAQIPRRLQYSTTDKAVNSANYAAAVARQGADVFLTHFYWDKNQTLAPTYEPPNLPTFSGCGVR